MNIEEKSLCPAFLILFPDHIIFQNFYNLNDYLKIDLFCILDHKLTCFVETRLPNNLFDVFFTHKKKSREITNYNGEKLTEGICGREMLWSFKTLVGDFCNVADITHQVFIIFCHWF